MRSPRRARTLCGVWWLAVVLCSFCVETPQPPACSQTAECFALADAYAHGEGKPKNEAIALSLFTKLCDEAGDGAACYNASALLAESEAPRAARYLEVACTAKVLVGCADLGSALREGHGVPKDATRARALLTRACRGAVAEACAELSEMWAAGEGGEKDAAKAKALRKVACELGDEPTCAK